MDKFLFLWPWTFAKQLQVSCLQQEIISQLNDESYWYGDCQRIGIFVFASIEHGEKFLEIS